MKTVTSWQNILVGTPAALLKAIREEMPVQDLELLGVSSKAVSLLQNADYFTVKQLVNASEKQLRQIKSIGDVAIRQVRSALVRLDEVENCRANYHRKFDQKMVEWQERATVCMACGMTGQL